MYFQLALFLNTNVGFACVACHDEADEISGARDCGRRHLLLFIERHIKREIGVVAVGRPLKTGFEGPSSITMKPARRADAPISSNEPRWLNNRKYHICFAAAAARSSSFGDLSSHSHIKALH
jgi:hypothetical protein